MGKWQLPWPKSWVKRRRILIPRFSFSVRDCTVCLVLFVVTVLLCFGLRHIDPNNDTRYVAMLFLLDVFLTAFLTEGYFFGVLAAVMGVLAVDYAFTEPYWEVSFVITGFPLTFLVMMFISVATSMITSRARRAAAAAREAERQQMTANLLRAVSHDIRTPLTGIVGATNVLLEQDNLSPEQRKGLLQDINEDAQWLIQVVENLLSITRVGSSAARLHKSWEALEEVVAAPVSKFTKRHPGIRAEVKVPEELLMVPMDPLLIQQVFTNLLENAAIHGGGITRVTVAMDQIQKKDGAYARVTVEDDGQGIDPEKLPRIFDGQLGGSRGDIKRNMGIGLSVCRTIVRAHGGNICAENKPDGGARFRVELPMKEEEHENQG